MSFEKPFDSPLGGVYAERSEVLGVHSLLLRCSSLSTVERLRMLHSVRTPDAGLAFYDYRLRININKKNGVFPTPQTVSVKRGLDTRFLTIDPQLQPPQPILLQTDCTLAPISPPDSP